MQGEQLTTKRRGEVAEAAFLYKATALGFSVAKPWGESDRYDFIVDVNGRCWRVQVKSAHSSALNGYSFHGCGNVRKNRYTARDIDFIVGYVVPDDAWYVIPIAAYADRTTIKSLPLQPPPHVPLRNLPRSLALFANSRVHLSDVEACRIPQLCHPDRSRSSRTR